MLPVVLRIDHHILVSIGIYDHPGPVDGVISGEWTIIPVGVSAWAMAH